MWVLKLGGSLQSSGHLRAWIKKIESLASQPFVVVAGGGVFADQVRLQQQRHKFSDNAAHRMALLAMQQFAHMLVDMSNDHISAVPRDAIPQTLNSGRIPVWLPDYHLLDYRGIPASWQISSDSLAVWLATELKARHLFLVKSTDVSGFKKDPKEWAQHGLVDQAFPSFVESIGFSISLLDATDSANFQPEVLLKTLD